MPDAAVDRVTALRQSAVAGRIRRHRLIAILRRIEPRERLLDLASGLAADGVRVLEVTFDAPTAADDLVAVRERLRSDGVDAVVGAGTILGAARLEAAVAADAPFLVAPTLDRAMATLVRDLVDRGMWRNTVVLWMGEFGRTPRINQNAGRDHWARSWSVVLGGGGLVAGRVIGETNADGTSVESEPYSSEDLMATVCRGLGISLETRFTAKNGRPMKIANGGKVIEAALA